MVRHEGGTTVRLDLVGPEGIIGSITLQRGLLPLLAYRLLEAADLGGIASQGALERLKEGMGHNGAGNGQGHSEAIQAAYQAYRQTLGAEDAMTRDKFKDLFKRKGGKKGR